MTAQTKGQLLVLKCLLMKDFFFFTSLSICSKPFLKERSSDDSSHASPIINLLTELGMNITFL